MKWLAPTPHDKKVLGLNLAAYWSLSVWRLHVLPVRAWVSSRHPGFLPQSKADWVNWLLKISHRCECEFEQLFILVLALS